MQRNMNRSIPAGEAMDIAKQVLLAILMLILLSVLIPVRAEEAVSPMIVSETADSTEHPALEAEADIPVITSEGKSNVKIAGGQVEKQAGALHHPGNAAPGGRKLSGADGGSGKVHRLSVCIRRQQAVHRV